MSNFIKVSNFVKKGGAFWVEPDGLFRKGRLFFESPERGFERGRLSRKGSFESPERVVYHKPRKGLRWTTESWLLQLKAGAQFRKSPGRTADNETLRVTAESSKSGKKTPFWPIFLVKMEN